MTARAATSAVTAHLPTLRSVYSLFGRHPNPPLRTTNRFFYNLYTDADIGEVEPFVRYENLSKKREYASINNDEPMFLARRRFSEPMFLARRRFSGDACYTALSVEDDGKLSPKYDIHPPFPPISGDAFHDAYLLEEFLCWSDNYPKPSAYRSCSSSNGLFCFHNMKSDIFLWNPTTNESKILPPSPSIADPSPRIAYHIRSSGIWVDPESQDYKVMRLMSARVDDDDDDRFGYRILDSFCEIELYSLKTDSWKRISCLGFFDFKPPRACINGLHGVQYFHAYRNKDIERVILSFDFSTETISSIPLPDLDGACAPYFDLLDYNGLPSLLAYGTENDDGEKSYQHWVRRDGSWCREAFFRTRGVNRPISFSRNGRFLFFESLNHEVLAFDCATGKLKFLHVKSYDYVLNLIPFSKSYVKLSREDLINLEEKEKEEEGLMVDVEEGPLMA